MTSSGGGGGGGEHGGQWWGGGGGIKLNPKPKLEESIRYVSPGMWISSELQICVNESRGVRPGLPVLMVSMDVKPHWSSSPNQSLIRYGSPAMWISRVPDLCQWKSRCPSRTPRPYIPYGLYGRKATLRLIPKPKLDKVRVPSNVDLIRPQGLCHEGQGVRPGLPVLIFLVVSVDVKQHWSSSPNQNLIRYRSPAMWISRVPDLCQWKSRCPSWTPRPYSPYGLYGRKATVRLIPEPKLDTVRVLSNVDLIRAPDLRQWKSRCPSWTPRPYGLCGRKATVRLIPKPKLDKVQVPSNVDLKSSRSVSVKVKVSVLDSPSL